MLFLLISVVLCVLLHVSAMALSGMALGVTLREVSIGFGPTILRIGRLRIRMLPVGGSVQFKDSREEVPDGWGSDLDTADLHAGQEPDRDQAMRHDERDTGPDSVTRYDEQNPSPDRVKRFDEQNIGPERSMRSGEHDAASGRADLPGQREEAYPNGSSLDGALEQRSPLIQIAIGLAGCLALVMMAGLTWQAAGLRAVIDGFPQIVAGAVSPLDTAQGLIAAAQQVLVGLPFLGVLGLVAAKFAAFNLLPLPAANGGFVLATIGRALGIDRVWPASLTTGLLFIYIGIALSWLVALGAYGLR